jgi:predicted ester cyclase
MKKYLWGISLVVLLCFTVACQDKAAMAELEKYKAQAAIEEQNKAVVTHYFDAFQKEDFEAIKAMSSPDYISHSRGRIYHLKDISDSIIANRETFSEISIVVEDIIARADKVAVRYLAKGTLRGSHKEGEPVVAEGTKIEITGYDIDRLENGKIVESWGNQDDLSLFEQIGYELKPKQEKKK